MTTLPSMAELLRREVPGDLTLGEFKKFIMTMPELVALRQISKHPERARPAMA